MADKFTWALGPWRESFVLVHENEEKQHKPLVVGVVSLFPGGPPFSREWSWRVLGAEGDQGTRPKVSYPACGTTFEQLDATGFCEAAAKERILRLGRGSVGPNGRATG